MTNREIVEQIYRGRYNFYFMIAYRACERWDMAEDIVHNGFIRLLCTKADLQCVQDASAYLTVCIRHAVWERLNSEQRIRSIRRDFLYTTCKPGEDAPLLLKAKALVAKVRSLTRRTILEEIYLHRKTRAEVAHSYGITRQTVSLYERKGLRELKQLFTSGQLIYAY